MGWYLHHAIVVTSFNERMIRKARDAAIKTGNLVSDIVESPINAYWSFFVAPDGSKEGWKESDKGDAARAAFVVWLKGQRYEDGSSCLTWVELIVGGDEIEPYIVKRGDEKCRR